jgi:adenylate cyclase
VALVGLGFVAFAAGVLMPVAAFALSSAVVLMGVIGWRLSGEERERARLRQMFGRYVSNQVVEELLQSGERPELGGKMQMVTVLFSDIRNFTTMSELLNPKEVVEMLNTYFEQACAVVLKEGGSIDKFIGDAIMVEFGSPMPVPDHAVRAVSAALALRDVAHEFGNWMDARFPGRNLPKFAVGIGLHSGDALIGNIGSSSRMEFTAIGDTVNLASRVEGKTKELGCTILATQATKTAAGDALVTGRCECIQVKGRTAAVNVYEVIGFKTEVNNV